MVPMVAATVIATAVARYIDGYSIYSGGCHRSGAARRGGRERSAASPVMPGPMAWTPRDQYTADSHHQATPARPTVPRDNKRGRSGRAGG